MSYSNLKSACRSRVILTLGAAVGLAFGSVGWGCVSDAFACLSDADCQGAGPEPSCEPTGFCSYEDDECPSGRRYGALAGVRSGLCVFPGEDDGPGPVAGSTGDDAPIPGGGTTSGGPRGDTGGAEGTEPGTTSGGGGGDDDAPPPSDDTSGPGGGEEGGGADGVPGDSTGADAPRVLMVVDQSAETDPVGDDAIASRLEARGLVVDRIDDDVAQTSDAQGCVLVLLSSTTSSGAVGTKFRDVEVPVIVWEHNLFDDMGMSNDNGIDGGSFVQIVDDEHPMAAARSGIVRAFDSDQAMRGGNPGPGATVVAQTISDTPLAAAFVYDAGADMPGGEAPDVRIGLFLDDNAAAALSEDGSAMIEAAFDFALGQ